MIHPTAEVSPEARIGPNTRIWHYCHVRAGAIIGAECVLGRNVYIEDGVVVGNRVKIQNNVSVYRGVQLEDGVFVGPHATFTNDRHPRAINPDGSLKGADDWTVSPTRVRRGAAIGAGAVVVCGLEIGEFALVGAGAVVVRDVPAHGLVLGNPARLVGYVCACARRLRPATGAAGQPVLRCTHCWLDYDIAQPRLATAQPVPLAARAAGG
ncbi:MAG TPA: acyltransferase [Chloroflexota bacterium]|nr:acyltransferase [Chloroflexota bacterium]